jgi:hypothetical protein
MVGLTIIWVLEDVARDNLVAFLYTPSLVDSIEVKDLCGYCPDEPLAEGN